MQEVIGSTPLCSTNPASSGVFLLKNNLTDMVKIYILIAYLLVANIIAFFLFGRDKKNAKKRKKRIPENVLLLMARIGGGLGCWAGMTYFHHKKHSKFSTLVPVWIIVWMLVAVLLIAIWSGNIGEELRTMFRS